MDKLYQAAGYLAGAFLITVFICVLAGIVSRLPGTPLNFQGGDAYAGYAMAASSFLALAATFRHGEHIRVTILFDRLKGRAQWALDMVCHFIALVIVALLVWFSGRLAYQSYLFHDVSTGLDATPLWIPQLGMLIGSLLFFLSLIESFVALIRRQEKAQLASQEQPKFME